MNVVIYYLGLSGNISTDCILDVRITNLDAPSNIRRKLEAVLLLEKKKKYLQACLDQRRHFSLSLFVVSCDGVLGNEAKVLQYYETLLEASPKKSGSPIPKLQTS